MRKITNAEIRALKKIIREQREEIVDLRAQLEESRSKEGMGVLENMLDGIRNCISSIDFSSLMKINHSDLLDNELTIENDEEE